MSIYKGFSTISAGKKYSLVDFNLVMQDLYNHLHTRRGERLMNPKFGCIVWELLFEPLTSDIQDAIVKNLTDIVAYDPRLSVASIDVSEYYNGLQIQMEVEYLLTNEVRTMQVQFDRETT